MIGYFCVHYACRRRAEFPTARSEADRLVDTRDGHDAALGDGATRHAATPENRHSAALGDGATRHSATPENRHSAALGNAAAAAGDDDDRGRRRRRPRTTTRRGRGADA